MRQKKALRINVEFSQFLPLKQVKFYAIERINGDSIYAQNTKSATPRQCFVTLSTGLGAAARESQIQATRAEYFYLPAAAFATAIFSAAFFTSSMAAL
jgi:hypothetical protein